MAKIPNIQNNFLVKKLWNDHIPEVTEFNVTFYNYYI